MAETTVLPAVRPPSLSPPLPREWMPVLRGANERSGEMLRMVGFLLKGFLRSRLLLELGPDETAYARRMTAEPAAIWRKNGRGEQTIATATVRRWTGLDSRVRSIDDDVRYLNLGLNNSMQNCAVFVQSACLHAPCLWCLGHSRLFYPPNQGTPRAWSLRFETLLTTLPSSASGPTRPANSRPMDACPACLSQLQSKADCTCIAAWPESVTSTWPADALHHRGWESREYHGLGWVREARGMHTGDHLAASEQGSHLRMSRNKKEKAITSSIMVWKHSAEAAQ